MFPRILKVCLSHLRYSWALFARHHPTHIATKIGGGGQGNSTINTHILYYPSDLKYHYLGTLVGVIYEPSIKWRMGASKPLKVPTCNTLPTESLSGRRPWRRLLGSLTSIVAGRVSSSRRSGLGRPVETHTPPQAASRGPFVYYRFTGSKPTNHHPSRPYNHTSHSHQPAPLPQFAPT